MAKSSPKKKRVLKKKPTAGTTTRRRSSKAKTSPPADKPKAGSKAEPTLAFGRMLIETVPIEKLKPAPYNPRRELQPGDPEYDKLKGSIDGFGYVDTIIWNRRTGHVVGGHQRLGVLIREHDIKEADVSVVDLTLEKEKALNVALNKIEGGWDDDKLKLLMIDLQESDIEATLTGFDTDEIDTLLMLDEPAPDPDPSPQLGDVEFKVIVTCDGEDQQRELLERFQQEGLTVSAMVT